jgi:hypothetical protein
MKRLFILTAVTCLLGLTGCEKFLSKVPNNNRTNLDSPEKVSQLLASAYPQGNYMNFAESMSDNVADIGTGSNDDINADSFFFKVVGDDQQDSPEFYWTSCYAAIAAANQALDAIGQAPNPEAYSSQKGERWLQGRILISCSLLSSRKYTMKMRQPTWAYHMLPCRKRLFLNNTAGAP